MGIEGLQKVAVIILLIVGLVVGWFFNSMYLGVQSVVEGLKPPALADRQQAAQHVQKGTHVESGCVYIGTSCVVSSP